MTTTPATCQNDSRTAKTAAAYMADLAAKKADRYETAILTAALMAASEQKTEAAEMAAAKMAYDKLAAEVAAELAVKELTAEMAVKERTLSEWQAAANLAV